MNQIALPNPTACLDQIALERQFLRAPQTPLRAGPRLDSDRFAQVRRNAVLHGCKWDPQVGDVGTLADFPLFLRRQTWNKLAAEAEALSRELLAAEQEIVGRPEWVKRLGFARPLCRALRGVGDSPTPAALRVMRFDFHPTPDGWRLSEVNSDVPGGYSEASFFTGLMADHFPDSQPAGNPASVFTEALVRSVGAGTTIALLSAPGYMEDHEIMAYLGGLLRERGCRVHLAHPRQLGWRDGIAHLDASWYRGPVDGTVRFFQIEWLARLPRRCGWEHFFHHGRTPAVHPGIVAISESKRFPLLWDRLRTPMNTWRRLLPETRDPRDAPWQRDDGWLVKSAMSNTGDDVSMRELLPQRTWRRVRWSVRLEPSRWVAQRRFDAVAIPTPVGLRHVCLGVYAINGRAAGIYTRISPRPLIDYSAVDAATLVVNDD